MDDRNLSGQTPLHAVAGDNNEAVVRFYVELGADVSAQDHNGQTPLHLAAIQRNSAIAELLLESREARFLRCITTLLTHVLTQARDSRGWAPNLWDSLRLANYELKELDPSYKAVAVGLKRKEIYLFFRELSHKLQRCFRVERNSARPGYAGLDVLDKLLTQLHHIFDDNLSQSEQRRLQSCISGVSGMEAMDAVHRYLRYIPGLRLDLIRRQIQIPDTAARTALHLAAERIDNDDVIDLLLSHGPDVSLKDNKGRTALHLAAAQFSNTKAIDLLLQHHPGINLQDEQGQTALHLAADTRNNIKNIELLVNAGVNTNLQDLKGRTALHLAVDKEHNETVIDFLLLSGAHINTLDNEQRPSLPNSENRLREAIENDQKDITEALLDGGVDGVSGRPGYGQKALGFSVARGVPGKEMAFWLLLRKGVGVNTANGHKALLLASDWWEKWDKANYALRALLSPSDPSKELFELLWKVNLGMEVEGETIIYRLLAERKYPHVIWALLRTDDAKWPPARVAKSDLTRALPLAARNKMWFVATQLVEKGADTNVNVGNVSLLAFMKDGKQVPDCDDCDSGSPCTCGIHKHYRDLLELVSGRGALV